MAILRQKFSLVQCLVIQVIHCCLSISRTVTAIEKTIENAVLIFNLKKAFKLKYVPRTTGNRLTSKSDFLNRVNANVGKLKLIMCYRPPLGPLPFTAIQGGWLTIKCSPWLNYHTRWKVTHTWLEHGLIPLFLLWTHLFGPWWQITENSMAKNDPEGKSNRYWKRSTYNTEYQFPNRPDSNNTN